MHVTEAGIWGVGATLIVSLVTHLLLHRRRQTKAILEAAAPVQIQRLHAEERTEIRLWQRLETLEANVDKLQDDLRVAQIRSERLAVENEALRDTVKRLERHIAQQRDELLRSFVETKLPGERPPPPLRKLR